MYSFLLPLHSIIRWVVLIIIVIGFIKGLQGRSGGKSYTKQDNLIRILAIAVFHTQVIIGFILYSISPIIKYFMQDTQTAMKDSNTRFFAIEHATIMLIAAIVLTIGSSKIKKAADDKSKFSKMALFFGITLLLIFIAIPWPFSPFTARPWFRF